MILENNHYYVFSKLLQNIYQDISCCAWCLSIYVRSSDAIGWGPPGTEQDSARFWESQFLSRLTRNSGSLRRRKKSGALKEGIGVWNSQGGGKNKSFFFCNPWKEVSESEVAQSCPTLCDPMCCSLPGSSVHGIFQAIVLVWMAISFSSGSSQSRDGTQVSHIVDRCFTVWASLSEDYITRIYPAWGHVSPSWKPSD